MKKKYLTKIIATDNEGLQMISACCMGGEVKISDIKYLKKNKVFLFSLERASIESKKNVKKINSICKFEFVDRVKSKKIQQQASDQKLKLIAIDYLKNNDIYEINLIFEDNKHIALSTEIIEATLEDQNEII